MNGFEIGAVLLAWGLFMVWMCTPNEEEHFKRQLRKRMKVPIPVARNYTHPTLGRDMRQTRPSPEKPS